MRPTTRPKHPESVVEARLCSKKAGEVRKDSPGCLLLLIPDSLTFCLSLHPRFRRYRVVAMLSSDSILLPDRLREKGRVPLRFIRLFHKASEVRVHTEGSVGSHRIQQYSMIYTRTVAYLITSMPPRQKIECGCTVGVIHTYVDDINAALISVEDVELARQISNSVVMAE